MGVPMELRVADPVPAHHAPVASSQLQQFFQRCAQAGKKRMFAVARLSFLRSAVQGR